MSSMQLGQIQDFEDHGFFASVAYERVDKDTVSVSVYLTGRKLPLIARFADHSEAMEFVDNELSRLSGGWTDIDPDHKIAE